MAAASQPRALVVRCRSRAATKCVGCGSRAQRLSAERSRSVAAMDVAEIQSDEEAERWLTPGVRGIGTASLLADLGHEIPTALLPSFLTATLGAPASALGLIEGVSDGLAGAARLAGGALADDPHRRRTAAIGGYTTTAVLSGLIGVATSAWQVALLRAGAWTARGLRVPARNALLADVVPASAYGRAYGFERAMDNLGAIGGPLLALGLVALVGVRTAILLSIIPGLLAVAAILYAIRHTDGRRRTRAPADPPARAPGAAWPARPADGRHLGVRAGQCRRDAADPARHRPAHAGPRRRRRGAGRDRALRRLQPRRHARQRPGRPARRPARDGPRSRRRYRRLWLRLRRLRSHRREHPAAGRGVRPGRHRDRLRRDRRARRRRHPRPRARPRLRVRRPGRRAEPGQPRSPQPPPG